MNDLFGQTKNIQTGHAGPRTLTRAQKKKNKQTNKQTNILYKQLQNEHQKQTVASLRIKEFKLTALTTSYGRLFHTRQTRPAKLNLRTSSRQSGKYNLKLCPRV